MQASWNQIDKLIAGSAYEQRDRERILDRLFELESILAFEDNEFYQIEMSKIIKDLRDNQLDPITHLGAYNQGDIIKHLRKLR